VVHTRRYLRVVGGFTTADTAACEPGRRFLHTGFSTPYCGVTWRNSRPSGRSVHTPRVPCVACLCRALASFQAARVACQSAGREATLRQCRQIRHLRPPFHRLDALRRDREAKDGQAAVRLPVGADWPRDAVAGCIKAALAGLASPERAGKRPRGGAERSA